MTLLRASRWMKARGLHPFDRNAIQLAAHRGELRFFRREGGLMLFAAADLEAFARQRANETASEARERRAVAV
jgi:hypothetical protein